MTDLAYAQVCATPLSFSLFLSLLSSRYVILGVQVTQYGMNAAVGPVIYRIPRSANEGKKKMSNAVMSTIDREVRLSSTPCKDHDCAAR